MSKSLKFKIHFEFALEVKMGLNNIRLPLGKVIPLMLSAFMAISIVEASAKDSNTIELTDIMTLSISGVYFTVANNEKFPRI